MASRGTNFPVHFLTHWQFLLLPPFANSSSWIFKLKSRPCHKALPHSVESLFPSDRTPPSLVTSGRPCMLRITKSTALTFASPGVQPPTQHLTQNVHRASQTFHVSTLIPHRPCTLISPHPILLISANGYFILTFSQIKTLCRPWVLFPIFITNHQPTLHALPAEYTRSQPLLVTISPSLFKEATTMASLLSPSSPALDYQASCQKEPFESPDRILCLLCRWLSISESKLSRQPTARAATLTS